MNKRAVKPLSLLLAVIIILSILCACGNTLQSEPSTDGTQSTETASLAEPANETVSANAETTAVPEGKTLVIYFSHTGTTKEVAAYVHGLVGGDFVEIIPVEAYPEGYSAALDPAKEEQRKNARPAIRDPLDSIDEYDVIYLGYPIWWGTVPMIVNTFLESYDFAGKTVVPFATSGGTGITQSIKDIRGEIPTADVKDGLLVRSNDSILPWLQELGLHA